MRRNCSLEEISDGRLYTAKDLVEVSCNGCKGKASCCHGMGNSIILDPFDVHRLTTNLKLPFEALLRDHIELNLVDGVILPSLKMSGPSEGCSFLNPGGKCSIHAFRPGICRIFPLGRYYESHSFTYILQKNECRNPSKTKTKVDKWIDTPEQEKNDQFLIDWHYFLNDVEAVIRNVQDEKLVKNLNMYLLNRFYFKPYDQETDFYGQFMERLEEAKGIIKLQEG
ncbi:MAG TPA: YkgJ family cysteine cluster protein [Clostridiales bacterium]|nr:YkgJ family cysteine cluster protein [Clostridiales bacterium]